MKKTFKKPITKILLVSTFAALGIIACKKNESSSPVSESSQTVNKNALNTQGLPLDNQHVITLEQANTLINRFKTNYPLLNSTSYFTGAAVRNVLSQEGVNRVKFYFGNDILGQSELFMLGMNSNGNDMVNGTIISSVFLPLIGNPVITQLLNWTDNQLINLNTAAAATARHRTNYSSINFGVSFTQDAIRALVIDETVSGVRVDYGMTENNQWTVVLRSVDSDGNVYANAIVLDNGMACPPNCSSANVLISL